MYTEENDESVISNYPSIEECEEYVRTGFSDKKLTDCDKHVIGSVWAYIEGKLVEKDWKHKIQELKMPEHWKDENVEEPNDIAKRNAMFICLILETSFQIYPDCISCTRENGVYFKYSKGLFSLTFETYNDGDIGCIVTNDQEKITLKNEDIKDFDIHEIMRFYLEESDKNDGI